MGMEMRETKRIGDLRKNVGEMGESQHFISVDRRKKQKAHE